MDATTKLELQKIACRIRMGIIEGTFCAKSGHPGGSLSIADDLAYLYWKELRIDPKNPACPDRDRMVLSKGHCAPGLYAALALRGYFPVEDLKTFRHTTSYLQGHPDMKGTPGVDMTTVKFVELDGFQSVVEAVLKGEADVGFVNSGFGQNARTQGLEVPFLVGEYAPNAVCCRQTALKSNVEANRDAYVRFEIANLRAMMLMLTDKETTIAKLVEFSGLDEQYVYNCIYDGVMKISMDPSANRVQEFYEIMQANGDIAADSEYNMTDHIDSGIYYDALTTVMERYPDFDGWTAMMEAYEENNL